MEETYRRLEPHPVILVDLQLFDRASSMEAHVAREHVEAGVVSTRVDDRFFALHDAWRGIPRITVCLERMARLPGPVQIGSLQHEVGHSVLHGELRYYRLAQPRAFQAVQTRYGLSPHYMADLLYLTSLAVKDYEVTRFLVEHGFHQEQTAYVESLFTSGPEDAVTWRVAQDRPEAQVLVLVSTLKPLFCAAGFYPKEDCKDAMEAKVKAYAYLPPPFQRMLQQVTSDAVQLSIGQTPENLERTARAISTEIIDSLLQK